MKNYRNTILILFILGLLLIPNQSIVSFGNNQSPSTKQDLIINQSPVVWTAESTRKIFEDQQSTSKLYTTPESSVGVYLPIAKNGVDFFQIVVSAGSSDLQSIQISMADFSDGNGNTISSTNIKPYLEYYINVRSTTWYESVINYEMGNYPDALIPIVNSFSVSASKNQPLWIEVNVPADAVPGKYVGKITFFGGLEASIDISLEVAPFEVPSKTGLFNPAYVDFWELEDMTNSDPEYRALIKTYTEFLTKREIIPDAIDLLDIFPTKSGDSWDFSQWYDTMKFFISGIDSDYKSLVLRAPVTFEHIGIDFDSADSQDSQDEYIKYVTEFKDFILSKSSELPNITWYIWIDELDEPQTNYAAWLIARYAEITASINSNELFFQYRVDGDINWKQPFAVDDYDGVDPSDWVNLDDKYTMWLVPQEDFEFDLTYMKNAISEGRGVMIYQQAWTAIEQGDEDIPAGITDKDYEFPSLPGIVNPALFSRILPWFVWKFDAIGIGFWAVNAWYNAKTDKMINPWVDDPALQIAEDLKSQSGDGMLIYPGNRISQYSNQKDTKEPVSSIRLELYRKGLEDYKYLKLLVDNLDKFDAADKTTAQNLIDDINANLITTISDFSRSIKDYDDKIFEVITLLSKLTSVDSKPIDINWMNSWTLSSVTIDVPAKEEDDSLPFNFQGFLLGLGLLVILKKKIKIIKI